MVIFGGLMVKIFILSVEDSGFKLNRGKLYRYFNIFLLSNKSCWLLW